jgi:cell division protein FtsA
MQNSKAHLPIIVGLDIGTTKIAAIAARKNQFGKIEIIGYGKCESQGVDAGMVLNITNVVNTINRALENCKENNPDLVFTDVYVGIAGKHIKSMQQLGEIVRENPDHIISYQDIDRLIKDQQKAFVPIGDEIIDIVPQDYIVDGYTGVTDPIGRIGTKFGANFHMITGDKGAIKAIHRSVEESELKVTDLVLQPLASAAAVMLKEEIEAGVAIVDIGGGTTDLAVFYEGKLMHTKVIPVAGVTITNDIKTGLGVLKSQAELLKIQFGCALTTEAPTNEYITIPAIGGGTSREISTKNLSHIIQARMEEIMSRVYMELKNNNLDKLLNAGIIITGGGSQLKYIKQLTEFITMCPARLGYPTEHLAKDFPREMSSPVYATCIGLILRGFSDLEFDRKQYDHSRNYLKSEMEMPQVEEPLIVTPPENLFNWTIEIERDEVVTASEQSDDISYNDLNSKSEDVTQIPVAETTSSTSNRAIDDQLENDESKGENPLSNLANAVSDRLSSINKLFKTTKNKIKDLLDDVDDNELDQDFK